MIQFHFLWNIQRRTSRRRCAFFNGQRKVSERILFKYLRRHRRAMPCQSWILQWNTSSGVDL